jgi:hypothetical protein
MPVHGGWPVAYFASLPASNPAPKAPRGGWYSCDTGHDTVTWSVAGGSACWFCGAVKS